jgi:hypothetical protein
MAVEAVFEEGDQNYVQEVGVPRSEKVQNKLHQCVQEEPKEAKKEDKEDDSGGGGCDTVVMETKKSCLKVIMTRGSTIPAHS